MPFLRYVFLRLYGMNLERKWRNSPDKACDDAVAQTMVTLVVPCSALLAIPLAIFVGVDSKAFHDSARWLILAVAALLYLLTRSFIKCARAPELADPFRSKKSRTTTRLLFFTLPIAGIGLFILDFHMLGQ